MTSLPPPGAAGALGGLGLGGGTASTSATPPPLAAASAFFGGLADAVRGRTGGGGGAADGGVLAEWNKYSSSAGERERERGVEAGYARVSNPIQASARALLALPLDHCPNTHQPSTAPSASDRLLARAEEGSTAAASVVQGAWARALAGVQAAAGGAAAAGTAIGR